MDRIAGSSTALETAVESIEKVLKRAATRFAIKYYVSISQVFLALPLFQIPTVSRRAAEGRV